MRTLELPALGLEELEEQDQVMLFVLIKDLRRSYQLQQLEALGDLPGPMAVEVAEETRALKI